MAMSHHRCAVRSPTWSGTSPTMRFMDLISSLKALRSVEVEGGLPPWPAIHCCAAWISSTAAGACGWVGVGVGRRRAEGGERVHTRASMDHRNDGSVYTLCACGCPPCRGTPRTPHHMACAGAQCRPAGRGPRSWRTGTALARGHGSWQAAGMGWVSEGGEGRCGTEGCERVLRLRLRPVRTGWPQSPGLADLGGGWLLASAARLGKAESQGSVLVRPGHGGEGAHLRSSTCVSGLDSMMTCSGRLACGPLGGGARPAWHAGDARSS